MPAVNITSVNRVGQILTVQGTVDGSLGSAAIDLRELGRVAATPAAKQQALAAALVNAAPPAPAPQPDLVPAGTITV